MPALAARAVSLVSTGLPLGEVPWGSHLCQFFKSERDLVDILVPFFAIGLASHEKCLWVASAPLPAERARAALADAVPDLDDRLAHGQIEILDHADWYTRSGSVRPAEVIEGWLALERDALAAGYRGLRISGNTAWLEPHQWTTFADYEELVHRAFHDRQILALCSYDIERCGPDEILDVVRNHRSALVRRDGKWEEIFSATAALALVPPHRVTADPPRLASELHHAEQSETTERAAIETAYEATRLAEREIREHLVALQRVTSALCEAASFRAIGEVVTGHIAPLLSASRCVLVIRGVLEAIRGVTTPDDPHVVATTLDMERALWCAAREAPPTLAWIGGARLAVIPLTMSGDRVGTLVLGFERDELAIEQRALVEDLARQVAIAIDRARSYELAEQQRLRAEAANTAKDQFLAMLGHELRNPLAPILTATQVMRLRAPDAVAKERASIERSVTHMMRLVDDLLDVARITRGKLELDRRRVELSQIVSQALEVAAAAVEQRGHRIHVSIASGLEIEVDRTRMTQVVSNLIVNAAKYTRAPGSIEIHGRSTGDHVELVVEDNGIGIAPDLLPHIFELFVQGAQGRDREHGGLGIGLAIARTIVELHGGTIRAESAGRGRGSRFTVQLPRSIARACQASHAPTVDTILSPNGKRILVVDDNEDAAWLLAEALRLSGHDVCVSHDGITALELARSWQPEIAFLDVGLPGMDGYVLCGHLSELRDRPHLVAVTGYGQASDRERALAAGFDLHFVKPVSLREVQAAIDAFVSSQARQPVTRT